MKNASFQKIITELARAGMLHRLTPKSQAAIFQLYPKPFRQPVQSSERIRQEWAGGRALKTDGTYWYSDNHQYRCSRENSHDIERRQRGGMWKRISDYEKYQEMPRAILRDFERAIEAKAIVESAVFS